MEILRAACILGLILIPRVNRHNAPTVLELVVYTATLLALAVITLAPIVIIGLLVR